MIRQSNYICDVFPQQGLPQRFLLVPYLRDCQLRVGHRRRPHRCYNKFHEKSVQHYFALVVVLALPALFALGCLALLALLCLLRLIRLLCSSCLGHVVGDYFCRAHGGTLFFCLIKHGVNTINNSKCFSGKLATSTPSASHSLTPSPYNYSSSSSSSSASRRSSSSGLSQSTSPQGAAPAKRVPGS